MACSSRSLITCGVAVAAVIAWRCRGSVRTDSRQQDPPRRGEAAVGKPADTHRLDGRSSMGVGIMFYDALSFVFGRRRHVFGCADDEGRKSSPGIGYPPSVGSLLLLGLLIGLFVKSPRRARRENFYVTDVNLRQYYDSP